MAQRVFEVPGFRASGVECGIKKSGRDLALIACEGPATSAGVFTRSSVVGAPIEWSRAVARRGRARAIVVNSGCSNVAMGDRGRRDARAMAECAARALGLASDEVFVASTGVIGRPLPLPKVRRGIAEAARQLRTRGWEDAARAIMTTDTFAKQASVRARLAGRDVVVAGIAKGSGMIEPNMATMLAFLATDAAVASPLLQRTLRRASDATFNRVTVDGESSTSDCALLLASGRAGNRPLRDATGADARRFADAVGEVCDQLARALARDGEGATKLVDVRVRGARTPAEAERAARRIANSMLVKTALYGEDPNWGRILQTVGAARVALALPRCRVAVCGVAVFAGGASTGPAALRRAAARLAQREIALEVDLGVGRAERQLWTCDLSADYVRINADYTT